MKKTSTKILFIILAIVFVAVVVIAIQANKSSKMADVYYFGVGEKALSAEHIAELATTSPKFPGENIIPYTLTISPVNQVWYFAYPETIAALTTIKDSNGFDLTSDFTVRDNELLPNSEGVKVPYRIYEYNNVTTLVDYKVVYK